MKKLVLLFFLPILGLAQPGSLDPSFDPGTGTDIFVRTISIQNDEKIIIGGGFTSYNGVPRNSIARLNTDGSLDTSFDPGTGANGDIYTSSIQSDGKIIIGGAFSSYDGTARNYIARLNTDGSLDTSFDPGSGANFGVLTTSIQSDGKIIIAGNFTSYAGTVRNYIARINTDGSLDTSFDPGTGANGAIKTSSIQSDGKIIIAGNFTSYSGTLRNYIARLNTDGSLDTTFDPGSGANFYMLATYIQSDGKIIIGGAFSSYDGTTRNYIARLNTDGSLDTSFDPGSGANSTIHTISIQSNGKIIIAGQFTDYNGTSKIGIARLNSNGSLDNSFDPGTGTGPDTGLFIFIGSTSIQSDGKIIVGGPFIEYDGTARNCVARVFAESTMGIDEMETKKMSIFPNPFSNNTTLQSINELNNAILTVYNLQGQAVKEMKNISGQTTIINRNNLPAGLYIVRISQDNQILMTDKLLITD
ncbi:MAG: T9SS type A sorting domain-containing protein [Flavobacteriaceae bacterium]